MIEGVQVGEGAISESADSLVGTASRINLAADAAKEFPGFHEARSKVRQRWYMLIVVGLLFVVLNAAVIGLIVGGLVIDLDFVTAHPELADKRMITSAVFQTLIAATVVQTGAITWAMARFLFPNQDP